MELAAAVFSSFLFFFFARAINITQVRDSVESPHGFTKYGCGLSASHDQLLFPAAATALWRLGKLYSHESSRLMVHSIHLLVLPQSCQYKNKLTSLQLSSFTPKNERKSCKMLIKTQDDVLKSPF